MVPDAPLELAFQKNYGQIVKHCWFGQGYIVVAFAEGWLHQWVGRLYRWGTLGLELAIQMSPTCTRRPISMAYAGSPHNLTV